MYSQCRRRNRQSDSAQGSTLDRLEEPFAICYEASCGYGHLYEQLRPLAHHVAVAHPGKLRLIYGSKRKNDRGLGG